MQGLIENLLQIWESYVLADPEEKEEELPFPTIVERAERKLGIKKRTVINYLNELIKNEILEKRVDEKRNTFYKPIRQGQVTKAVIKEKIDEMPPLIITQRSLKSMQKLHPLLGRLKGDRIQEMKPG